MKLKLLLLSMLFSMVIMAQNYTISGRITEVDDADEGLIGANIMYSETSGTVTDIDGYYELDLPAGNYTIRFSYVGYESVIKEITLNSNITLDVQLNSSVMMKEVLVVADVAIARETPVAFSTLSPKTLEENIAAQDIPMVLNSTPGVYATNEGGGDGDAQVTIRGFDSRNVGVLLDGVPVNDMENGHVYWSNWFGLDAVTRSMQVQRGLGASKLALPSVGGTINIITRGMESKKGGSFKQEFGSDGYIRSSFGYNSGVVKNGWSFSVAGSYKQSDGWVDQLYSQGVFYYAKVDKKLGNHIVSLSAYGAPQKHGQRSYKLPIAVYDSAYAADLGVKLDMYDGISSADSLEVYENRKNAVGGVGQGVRYNQHWGYLARNKDNPNAASEPLNERLNFYHKPQITLKDIWNVSEQLYVSNIAYLSIGRGGGSSDFSTISPSGTDGLKDYQTVYNKNINNLNTSYDANGNAATNYLKASMNEHFWYGFLSTVNYEYSSELSFSGGIDLRSYKGTHYAKVYDLLGADYATSSFVDYSEVDWTSAQPFENYKLYEGDIISYHTEGNVSWFGGFGQVEYKTEKLSAFLNLTAAKSFYTQTAFLYGIDEDITRRETGVNSFWGGTAKGGVNYNINDQMNAFANLGYLSKAPEFSSVYDYDNRLLTNIENEIVKALELGYSFATPVFSANINAYYTRWENKPMNTTTPDPQEPQESLSVNLNGMDALHKGVELDFVYKISAELDFQGLMSLGDWRWDTDGYSSLYDRDGSYIEDRYFNAKGVHVGNSAQTQFGGEVRWEPIKNLYFKPRATYFTRYYAQFEPGSLNPDDNPENFDAEGNPYDSWQIPSYTLIDLHMGYGWKVLDDYFLSVRLNVLNVLNTTYIATAQDNDPYNGQIFNTHDARSASVFMGLGRRYNMSLSLKF